MSNGYLVDTDWAIHYLNGHPEIVEKLQLLKKDGLRLSVVSLAELYEGIYYSRNPEESEAKLKTEIWEALTELHQPDDGSVFTDQEPDVEQIAESFDLQNQDEIAAE